MLEIKEAKTFKVKRDFVNLVDKIYKNHPYYVPTIKLDDYSILNPKKNANLRNAIFYPLVVYRNKKAVGRAIALINHLYQEKTGEIQARFYYFDIFDDFEACEFMFKEIIKWAKSHNATSLCGPLGFNDTEREGMLIEGFESLGTYVSLYNYPYYKEFMERLGFVKDADWLQHRIYLPTDSNHERVQKINRVSSLIQKRYKLRFGESKNHRDFIKKYGIPVFNVLNAAYAPLYGTIEFDEKAALSIIKGFKPMIKNDLCCVVLNEKDEVIGFTITFPNFSEAIIKSKGRLLPFGMFRLLRAIKKYDVIQLALMGVMPEYQNKGVNAMMMEFIGKIFYTKKIKYMESNLTLETNTSILAQLKDLDAEYYRKNRSWKLKI